MIHLFKKVYIASDRLIDINIDRVVVSAEHGLPTLKSIDELASGMLVAKAQSTGDLVGKGKEFKNYSDLFTVLGDWCEGTGKRVIIYADDESMSKILGMWFKVILKNEDKEVVTDLVESTLFKYRVFFQGRHSSNNGVREDFSVDLSKFGDLYDKLPKLSESARNKFLTANRDKFGVEFLLASYLADGSNKVALKSTIQALFRKELSIFMYELKELFFVHLITPKFAEQLDLNKSYDFSNYTEIVDDTSTYAELFMSDRLWPSKFMDVATTSGIKFENLTDDDIENLKEFAKIVGETWSETGIRSEISKLDHVDILSNFSDDRLDDFLESESVNDTSTGAFFSIDLETVNHYLIQELLRKDKKFAEKYAIA